MTVGSKPVSLFPCTTASWAPELFIFRLLLPVPGWKLTKNPIVQEPEETERHPSIAIHHNVVLECGCSNARYAARFLLEAVALPCTSIKISLIA